LLLKPQTVFALPVTMAGAGHWRPIVTACLAGAALVAASAAWLGVDVWLTFVGMFTGTVDFFLIDPVGKTLWGKYVSAYGFALHNGAPIWLAATAQAVVSAAALTVATVVLRRHGRTDAAIAIVIYAAVIAAPRLFVYDLPLLAIGALFHARAARVRGWSGAEASLLAAGLLLMEAAFIAVPQIAGVIAPALMAVACFRHCREAPISRCN